MRETAGSLWISDRMIDTWIEKLNNARLESEQNIIRANIDLNQRGQRAIRYVMAGILTGLIWILFIAKSMIQPFRELRKGIRSILYR